MRARQQTIRQGFGGAPVARAALAAAVMLALGSPARATDFTVTDAGDSGPGTLRQAALDANATGGPHTIAFALPSGTTIALTSGEIRFDGPDVAIAGPGRSRLTISGSNASRVFEVQGNATLTLGDVTLRDGFAAGDDSNEIDQRGGAILVGVPNVDFGVPPPPESPGLVLTNVDIFASRAYSPTDGGGGGVFMQDGRLAIDHCTIDGNFARRNGGGVTTRRGEVSITDSALTNNVADYSTAFDDPGVQGGGLLINRSGGTVTRTIVRGNRMTGPADGSGGAGGAGVQIYLEDEPVVIADSEISDNESVEVALSIGGGLGCRLENPDFSPTFTLINSTISGNTGALGAGMEAACNTVMLNSTIANNTSVLSYEEYGSPGIEAYSPQATQQTTLTFASSIVFGGLGGGRDIAFYLYSGYPDPTFVDSDHLIVGTTNDGIVLPADTMTGVDPLLAPLANNGGPTRTHALVAGSVAIDAGTNRNTLPFDQRGAPFAREAGAAADIGAFELDAGRIFADGFD
jgi:parallel beta helix pectate lyase-like protein